VYVNVTTSESDVGWPFLLNACSFNRFLVKWKCIRVICNFRCLLLWFALMLVLGRGIARNFCFGATYHTSIGGILRTFLTGSLSPSLWSRLKTAGLSWPSMRLCILLLSSLVLMLEKKDVKKITKVNVVQRLLFQVVLLARLSKKPSDFRRRWHFWNNNNNNIIIRFVKRQNVKRLPWRFRESPASFESRRYFDIPTYLYELYTMVLMY